MQSFKRISRTFLISSEDGSLCGKSSVSRFSSISEITDAIFERFESSFHKT